MMTSPDGVPVIALVAAYNGDLQTGEQVIKPLRAFGPPVADMVSPMPYTALQQMLDEGFPAGLQVYWRSSFLTVLSDEAIDTMVEHARQATSPLSAVMIEQFP